MNARVSESYKREHGVDFNLPSHVGIIMDGNGRWAKAQGKNRSEGHRAGVERVRDLVSCASAIGIECLTLYAFSTENWKRPGDEVKNLMALLLEYFKSNMSKLKKEGVRVNHLGDISRFQATVAMAIKSACEQTKNGDGLILNLALNYGSRDEITMAVRSIADDIKDNKIGTDDITEELISSRLYTGGQPDVDLIIRTSGEQRLSNFLMYQAAYAELVFVDDYFPDFTEDRFIQVLREYSKRDRRFGGVK